MKFTPRYTNLRRKFGNLSIISRKNWTTSSTYKGTCIFITYKNSTQLWFFLYFPHEFLMNYIYIYIYIYIYMGNIYMGNIYIYIYIYICIYIKQKQKCIIQETQLTIGLRVLDTMQVEWNNFDKVRWAFATRSFTCLQHDHRDPGDCVVDMWNFV